MEIGTRIELHAATDRWMMGDRFGVVVGMVKASGFIRVKLDRSGLTFRFRPCDVMPIDWRPVTLGGQS